MSLTQDYNQMVKGIISENLYIDVNDIKLKSKIVQDLGADSLDMVEMVMELEYVLNIEISDDVAINFITVQDIITYLEKK